MQISSGMSRSRRWRISSGSRAAAMPWPMRSAPRRNAAHTDSGPPALARVRRQPQARASGEGEDLGEPLRRTALLAAADAERHHAAVHALGRQLRPLAAPAPTPNCRTASRIQRTSTGEPAAASLTASKIGPNFLPLPQHHAGRQNDFGVAHVLRRQPLQQAPRGQPVVLGRAQPLAHLAEGLQKTVEIGILVERAQLFERRARGPARAAFRARPSLPGANAARLWAFPGGNRPYLSIKIS